MCIWLDYLSCSIPVWTKLKWLINILFYTCKDQTETQMESIDLGSIEKEGKILNVVVKYQRVGGKMGVSAQALTVLNSPFCLLQKDKISFWGFKRKQIGT